MPPTDSTILHTQLQLHLSKQQAEWTRALTHILGEEDRATNGEHTAHESAVGGGDEDTQVIARSARAGLGFEGNAERDATTNALISLKQKLKVGSRGRPPKIVQQRDGDEDGSESEGRASIVGSRRKMPNAHGGGGGEDLQNNREESVARDNYKEGVAANGGSSLVTSRDGQVSAGSTNWRRRGPASFLDEVLGERERKRKKREEKTGKRVGSAQVGCERIVPVRGNTRVGTDDAVGDGAQLPGSSLMNGASSITEDVTTPLGVMKTETVDQGAVDDDDDNEDGNMGGEKQARDRTKESEAERRRRENREKKARLKQKRQMQKEIVPA